MKTFLLSTFFHFDQFKRVFWEVKPDKTYLFMQEEETKVSKLELEKLQKAVKEFHDVSNVEIIKAPMYNTVAFAEKAVGVIDQIAPNAEKKLGRVVINITSGRKTMAMGLLFGAYARSALIDSIMYMIEESESVMHLPKMYYNLSASQIELLQHIRKHGVKPISDLESELKRSKSILYKNLKDLADQGLMEQDTWQLTDFGRIAVLRGESNGSKRRECARHRIYFSAGCRSAWHYLHRNCGNARRQRYGNPIESNGRSMRPILFLWCRQAAPETA